MEITLEKIELVKDRTGVSYKEAKEALEAADGSVVDAIINIEESIDIKPQKGKLGEQGEAMLNKVRELIKKGNVSKIIVKKDGDVVLSLPLNVSIIGTILAPLGMIAGAIAAFGTKCTIEVVKEDGSIVDVSEMATETFGEVVEKSSGWAEGVKAKSTDIAEDLKVKGTEVFQNVKEKTEDALARKAAKKEDADGCEQAEAEEEEAGIPEGADKVPQED